MSRPTVKPLVSARASGALVAVSVLCLVACGRSTSVGGSASPTSGIVSTPSGTQPASLTGPSPEIPSASPTPDSPTPAPHPGELPAIAHIVVIVMENHEYGSVIGNPEASYINSLATTYSLATN